MSNARRPLKTRLNPIAIKSAFFLSKRNITPNQISVLSVVFSLAGSLFLIIGKSHFEMIICALCIQARLACNLLDGMIAIEGGKKTPTGIIFNEFPDRISDSTLIISLGYAAGLPWIGWFGALLAVSTAYIRLFGGAVGLEQDFSGPMAKQHRMAVMSAACILASFEIIFIKSTYFLSVGTIIIAVGSALTCVIRTKKIAALIAYAEKEK